MARVQDGNKIVVFCSQASVDKQGQTAQFLLMENAIGDREQRRAGPVPQSA